jgi:TRAP-type mannitol/chloroaromatic compound transport system substrate-binding protein
VGNIGGAMGGWFRKEIKGISDLKDMNIQTFGLGAKVYKKMGATTDWFITAENLDVYNNAYNKRYIWVIVIINYI